MKLFAGLLLTYTAVMLLIHVSTAKLLKAWGAPAESWMKRQFPPQRALRVEAIYWSFALVSWGLWPSLAWKAMVVAFATVHLGIWMASELHGIHLQTESAAASAQTSRTHQAIIAFDLVEACALIAMAWFAVSYLVHPRQHLLVQHAARLAFAHAWPHCSFV